MRIAVLVPTYRRPCELRRCLRALAEQTRRPDEVVVIVRETDCETQALLRNIGRVRPPLLSVTVRVPGLLAAMEAGLAQVRSEIVAITDDDAAPRPDWLARIDAHFRAGPRVGGVGGRDWVHFDGRVDTRNRRTVGKVQWFGRVIGNHHLGAGGPREVDVLKGVNCAYRRTALQQVGLDHQLRGTGAQVHWELSVGLRLRRAAWRLIYDPAVCVDHYPAPRFDEDQRNQQSRWAFRNEVFNETYALLNCLPPWQKAVAFIYGLTLGTRRAPGIAMLLARVVAVHAIEVDWMRFCAATTARFAALATVWRHIRDNRQRHAAEISAQTSETRSCDS